MICASIVESTLDGAVKASNQSKADLIEVRLDFIKNTSSINKLSRIKNPVIATCMPKWENGRFKGSERARIDLLKSTLPFVKYVTIELNTNPKLRSELIKEARKRKVKVIVAFHDFKKTPSTSKILGIVKREHAIGDIAKVAFMPKSSMDVLNLLSILSKVKKDVIVLSMGSLGRISRVLGPILGSYLTYGSVSKGREAGPGQLTVGELSSIISTLRGN